MKKLLRLADSRFRDVPSKCDTDGWHIYGKLLEKLGIEHGVVHYLREWKSIEGYHTNNIERFWEDYRSWERKARGYKRIENSSIYTVAYETFYNFFRPRLSLNTIRVLPTRKSTFILALSCCKSDAMDRARLERG